MVVKVFFRQIQKRWIELARSGGIPVTNEEFLVFKKKFYNVCIDAIITSYEKSRIPKNTLKTN
ncbi:MAG: hypothetical protein QXJ66_07390 [Candidatus Methanomethylicia archaeon]